jgi:hypothetical protein
VIAAGGLYITALSSAAKKDGGGGGAHFTDFCTNNRNYLSPIERPKAERRWLGGGRVLGYLDTRWY